MPRNASCQRCALHHAARTVCVWGDGPPDARLVLVGEAPGEQEDRTGVPFVGQAGQVLTSALAQAGLSRADVYATNAVRCKTIANRDPEPAELAACFPYLAEELATVQPRVIVALGGSAARALTGRPTTVKANRGKFLAPGRGVRLGEAKLIVTYHPAAYLHGRDPSVLTDLVADLKLAKSLAADTADAPTDHVRRFLLPGWDAAALRDACAGLGWCPPGDPVVVDCEWTAMTDRRIAWPWTRGAELYSVSLSWHPSGSTAVHSLGLAWPPTDDGRAVLSAFLRARRCVFHNAMADMLWLDAVGVRYTLAGDTMLLAYLLDEEQSGSLESLATTYCQLPPWKRPLWADRPRDAATWDALLTYNSDDTRATLLLAEALYRELRQRDAREHAHVMRVYAKLLLPALPVYVDLARAGIPLHEQRVLGAITVERDRERAALTTLADQIGGNLTTDRLRKVATSSNQTGQYLRAAYGLELDGSAKDDLAPYADTYPIIRTIQTIRNCQKNLGTYLEPWADLLRTQGDGRLHSVYRLGKVRTGRTSAETEKGGSVQVAPREAWVKKLIAAPAGYDLVAGDLSQIELRVAAWLAPEPTMLRIYNESRDADLHIASAALFLGLPRDQVTKAQRQIAKSANFGLLFGMQPDHFRSYAKMTYGVDLSPAEAARLHATFFATYPGLQAWHERMERVDFARGYTVTPFGRYRRHLVDARKAINTPVQSTADDLMKLALLQLWHALREHALQAQIIGSIHDSALVLSPHAETATVVRLLRTAMQRPETERLGVPFATIPVPLYAEILVGPSWAEGKEILDEVT